MRTFKHWHRLSREIAEHPPLEIFKTQLDMVLNDLLYVALLEHGGWTKQLPEVPSNLNHFVIL